MGLSRISLRKMGLTKAMCDGDYFCPSMKLKDLNLHRFLQNRILSVSDLLKLILSRIYYIHGLSSQ